MPTMTLRWPSEAVSDVKGLTLSLTQAVAAQPGAAVTITPIRDMTAFPVTLHWEAEFSARTEDDLTGIAGKVASGSVRALA